MNRILFSDWFSSLESHRARIHRNRFDFYTNGAVCQCIRDVEFCCFISFLRDRALLPDLFLHSSQHHLFCFVFSLYSIEFWYHHACVWMPIVCVCYCRWLYVVCRQTSNDNNKNHLLGAFKKQKNVQNDNNDRSDEKRNHNSKNKKKLLYEEHLESVNMFCYVLYAYAYACFVEWLRFARTRNWKKKLSCSYRQNIDLDFFSMFVCLFSFSSFSTYTCIAYAFFPSILF